MFFAVPVVGKILAGFAASEASAETSAAQKTTQSKVQSISGSAADPADFAQTLDTIDQAAAARTQHSLFNSAKA